MARSRLLAAVGFALPFGVLLLSSAASAQTFHPADGPWTRDHELVGSTPDGRVFARVGTRLGVTTDAGQTWTVVSETLAPTRIAGSGAVIYGAFPDGVRLSRDGGATWAPFGLDGLNIRDIALSETVYALTETSVYRLGDLAVWQPTTRPGAAEGARLARLDAAGGTVAVGAFEQQCSGIYARAAFYRSRDSGATWTRTSGTGFVADVAVALDGTAYFATSDGLGCLNQLTPGGLFSQGPGQAQASFRSGGDTGGVDIGPAGQPVTAPPGLDPSLHVSGLALSGDAVVFGTRAEAGACLDPPCSYQPPSGLYAVRAGEAEPVGFVPSEVRSLARVGGSPVVSSDGAVYRLSGGVLSYLPSTGDVRAFVSLPGQPGTVAALSGTYGGFLLGVPPSTAPDRLLSLQTTSAVVLGDRIVSASSAIYPPAGVFVTTAEGQSRPTLVYRDIGSVGVAASGATYAGAVDGVTYNGSAPPARLFRSDDRGETWTPDDAGMTARDVYAFTDAGPLHLVGTSSGVFARTPGAPWHLEGLEGRTVFTFTDAPDGLLAGTDDGLFRRDVAGTWTRTGAGLDGRSVYAVLTTTDATGAWTGVGTDAGLYQTRPFGVTAEAAPVASVLSVRTLPNPARGVRTVRLAGATGERLAVAVFDALGRVVADLGTVTAGDVLWDASGLPPGVYLVRVTAGSGASATVRAVVAR